MYFVYDRAFGNNVAIQTTVNVGIHSIWKLSITLSCTLNLLGNILKQSDFKLLYDEVVRSNLIHLNNRPRKVIL